MDDSIKAFPSVVPPGAGISMVNPGMTLRDWYAGMALQGMNANTKGYFLKYEFLAKRAYEQADAMIVERKKSEGQPI